MGLNTYGRLNTAYGEQGDHVPNLNPEVFGKDKDDRVSGNPAAATPPSNITSAEQVLYVAPEGDDADADAEEAARLAAEELAAQAEADAKAAEEAAAEELAAATLAAQAEALAAAQAAEAAAAAESDPEAEAEAEDVPTTEV